MTTLQKRFAFTTVMNGLIISSCDVGHCILLFILSFIGGKIHKPRALFVGCLASAISALLWALPHFIYGPGRKLTSPDTSNLSSVMPSYQELGVCTRFSNFNSLSFPERGEEKANEPSSESMGPFIFFVLSQCMIGAGLAPFVTVGFTYIDDNTEPQTSAMLVGVVMSIASLGGIAGFLAGSLFTSLYVDLSGKKGF